MITYKCGKIVLTHSYWRPIHTLSAEGNVMQSSYSTLSTGWPYVLFSQDMSCAQVLPRLSWLFFIKWWKCPGSHCFSWDYAGVEARVFVCMRLCSAWGRHAYKHMLSPHGPTQTHTWCVRKNITHTEHGVNELYCSGASSQQTQVLCTLLSGLRDSPAGFTSRIHQQDFSCQKAAAP